MPNPTAAPTDIQTAASIAQIRSVMASSSSPWCARRSPSVADAIGASSPCSVSLRRTNHQPTPTAEQPTIASSAISSTECPPTSPSSPQPTITKIASRTTTSSSRSASSVPTTERLDASARGAISTTRIASPARAGRMLLPA